MKQNRLNGVVAAYIHKALDINPDEILKLYRQMTYRGFDFGVVDDIPKKRDFVPFQAEMVS